MAIKIHKNRENHLYELSLEFAFGIPYETLLSQARNRDECDELDLLELGRRLYVDFARLARGDVSQISIPSRLPRRGEHREIVRRK